MTLKNGQVSDIGAVCPGKLSLPVLFPNWHRSDRGDSENFLEDSPGNLQMLFDPLFPFTLLNLGSSREREGNPNLIVIGGGNAGLAVAGRLAEDAFNHRRSIGSRPEC